MEGNLEFPIVALLGHVTGDVASVTSRFVRQTRLVAILRAERRPPSDFASDGPVD